MKKILLVLALFLVANISYAQKDVKAEKILSKVSQNYKNLNSFRIKFSLTVKNAEENINETSIGVADIKNDKYMISIMGADTYFDGKTRYTFLKDSEELNISEPEDEENELSNPAKIFSLYKNGFTYSLVKEYRKDGVNIVNIELIPTEEKEYSKVLLVINKDNNRIISFTSLGKDSNDVVLKITKLDTSHSFNDSYFVFDTKSHPNVEVIDMR